MKNNKFFIGILLILLGLILGLNALGITNINVFFEGWWTLFIIIPSLTNLLKNKDKENNVVVLIIGITLLLIAQDLLSVDLVIKLAIPFILVYIGLSFIIKNISNNKIVEKIKQVDKETKNYVVATFSSEKNTMCADYKTTSAEAIFGSVLLNMKDVVLKEENILKVCGIFGEVNLIIPKNVNVKINSTSIFGSVNNKIKNNTNNTKTIYIDVLCLFGGVNIK